MRKKTRIQFITLLMFSIYSGYALSQFPSRFELTSLNGNNGFYLTATNHGGSQTGVSNVGDVNKDGISDVMLSHLGEDINGMNTVNCYIIFGKTEEFEGSFDISKLNGSNGFKINSVNEGGWLWRSKGKGDINNDGIDDIIIGSRGVVYIIYGKDSGFPSTLDIDSLDGITGFVIKETESNLFFGKHVSVIKDFNGDQINDLIISEPFAFNQYENQIYQGATYIIFGSDVPFPENFNISSLNGNNGIMILGEHQYNGSEGGVVSDLGDINGDGVNDIGISTSVYSSDSNNSKRSVYVLFGSNQSLQNPFLLSSLNGNNGINIIDNNPFDNFVNELSISSAGDFNNDSIDDFMIGNSTSSINESKSGTVYLIYGTNLGFPSAIDLLNLNGLNGFNINGIGEFDRLGSVVSSAGDINNDNINDVIIRAHAATGLDDNMSVSYIIFGSEQIDSSPFDLNSLNGNNGFSIFGRNQTLSLVGDISNSGDINDDGIDDIILGGQGFTNDTYVENIAYVFYGRGDFIFKSDFE